MAVAFAATRFLRLRRQGNLHYWGDIPVPIPWPPNRRFLSRVTSLTPGLRDTRLLLLAIVALGAVLRFLGLNWDHGRGLHPDENNLVNAALTLGIDGRLLPEFHAYNDLALWLPRLLALPFCEASDRACLALVARTLSAAFSLAMIPLAAGIAARIATPDRRNHAALAAALAMAMSPPLVQWAHFGTTESAIGLLVLLLWFIALRWQTGDLTDRQLAILGGVALGVGFGFKTTALAIAVIPVTALALSPLAIGQRVRVLALFAAVLAIQALAFAPSVILATADWLAIMRFENGVVQGTVPVFWTEQFHGATNGVFELRQLWSLTSGAGLLLALTGLALLPRDRWRLALPGLAFAVLYAALTFGWHAKFVRYLAPLIPVILVLAGLGVAQILARVPSRTAQATALTGLALMAMAGIDSASAYLRPDPRVDAETRLMALARPGHSVVVEPRDLPQTGPLPRVTLPLVDGQASPQTLAAPLAGAEWLILASRRNWEVLPRQPGAAPVLCAYYAGLADGSLGYVPMLRSDRSGVFGRLFAPGLSAEETRVVFDRPEVFVFRNTAHLRAEDIAVALEQPRAPGDCAPRVLQRAWRAGP